MLLGYCRTSTADQNPDHQIDALLRNGVDRDNIHVDVASGAKASRPKLDLIMQLLIMQLMREGDTLNSDHSESLFFHICDGPRHPHSAPCVPAVVAGIPRMRRRGSLPGAAAPSPHPARSRRGYRPEGARRPETGRRERLLDRLGHRVGVDAGGRQDDRRAAEAAAGHPCAKRACLLLPGIWTWRV
jgi:hypothetical protein